MQEPVLRKKRCLLILFKQLTGKMTDYSTKDDGSRVNYCA
jgi:hypothetical protein